MELRPHHVYMEVSDLRRAVQFYTEVLGLPLVMETDGYARVGGDPFFLGLGLSEVPAEVRRGFRGPNVALSAEDVDAAFAVLRDRGVEFLSPPFWAAPEIRVAEFYDSEGNRLSLSSAP